LGDMKREFPSTPKEAFEASVEGAYYGNLMEAAEAQGRIGNFPAVPGVPVHTGWDIVHHDYTSIWFWQCLVGRIRIVGYFQDSGEGMPYYAEECRRLYARNNWMRQGAIDYVPHDARVTEWGSDKSRLEQMIEKQFKPQIARELSLEDGINAVRAVLPVCEFDASAAAEGIKTLKAYRKDWDEDRGAWRNKPRHDFSAHGADGFRPGVATPYREMAPPKDPKPFKMQARWPTMKELMDEHDRRAKLKRPRI